MHRIELVPHQPCRESLQTSPLRYGFRVRRLLPLCEIPPEVVIHFICHIKSPAVEFDFLDPIFSRIQQVRFTLRVGCVEFWHISVKTEGVV